MEALRSRFAFRSVRVRAAMRRVECSTRLHRDFEVHRSFAMADPAPGAESRTLVTLYGENAAVMRTMQDWRYKVTGC
jgi:hypothetical protein